MPTDHELEDLTKDDRDRPTLVSFFLIEFLKWGGLLLVIYVLFNFSEPLWRPVYDFCAWLAVGDHVEDSTSSTQPPGELNAQEGHHHK